MVPPYCALIYCAHQERILSKVVYGLILVALTSPALYSLVTASFPFIDVTFSSLIFKILTKYRKNICTQIFHLFPDTLVHAT